MTGTAAMVGKPLAMALAMLAMSAIARADDAPAQRKPAPRPAPIKPAPQLDFGLQWRAQDGAARNDLTNNTANSIRSTLPGAQPAGSGVNAGVQLKW
jgi:hypothetical protein